MIDLATYASGTTCDLNEGCLLRPHPNIDIPDPPIGAQTLAAGRHARTKRHVDDRIGSFEHRPVTFRNIARVAGLVGVPPKEFAVLLSLAGHAREDGTSAWPATETIANEVLLDRRTVALYLSRITERGIIEGTGTTRHGVQIFRVSLPDLDAHVNQRMAVIAFYHVLPPVERAVFIAIASAAGRQGQTGDRCPGLDALTERFQVSRSTVQRALRDLVGLKLLVQRWPGGGKGVNSSYDLNLCQDARDHIAEVRVLKERRAALRVVPS